MLACTGTSRQMDKLKWNEAYNHGSRIMYPCPLQMTKWGKCMEHCQPKVQSRCALLTLVNKLSSCFSRCLLNCNHYPPLQTAWSDYGSCLVIVCPVCLLWYVQSTRLCNPHLEAPPWMSTNYHLSDLWNDWSTNSICHGNFFRNPSCRVKRPLLLFGSFAPS